MALPESDIIFSYFFAARARPCLNATLDTNTFNCTARVGMSFSKSGSIGHIFPLVCSLFTCLLAEISPSTVDRVRHESCDISIRLISVATPFMGAKASSKNS